MSESSGRPSGNDRRPTAAGPPADGDEPSRQRGGGHRRSPYGGEPPYGAYGGSYYYGGTPYYGSAYYGESSSSPFFLGEISPRRLMRVARKKWPTVALATAFACCVAAFYLRMTVRVYRASSIVEMSVRRPRIMSAQSAVIDDQYYVQADEVFNTRLEKFRGPAMSQTILEKFRALSNASSFAESDARAASGAVSYELMRKTRLVRISVAHTNPALAAAVADAAAMAAEAVVMEENRLLSENAVAWLKSQGDNQRKILEKADQAIIDFRSKNQIDAIETRIKVVGESLSGINDSLAQIESKQVLNRELLKAMENIELSPENIGKLPGETPRITDIMTAVGKFTEAVSAREAMKSRYTDQHPEVIAAGQIVENLRRQAMDAIAQARETVLTNDRLLGQQAEGLRKRTGELSKEASELEVEVTKAKTELAALEREREAADMSYKGILNRIEEARLSADENTATVKMSRPASVPRAPVSPNPRRTFMLAILIGLAGGFGLALLKDLLEDYLHHDDDAERFFRVKVLGMVPRIERSDRQDVAWMTTTHKFSQFAESFASLRSVLDSGEYKDYARVLLVTSTAPGVGKTICSCNLAMAFAQRGERTLLIDFDMRRPQLRRVFSIPDEHESLLHVMHAQDSARFAKLPFGTKVEGLDVVCSRRGGEISVAEIIGGKTVKEFIEWARSRYDRVILDSPPYGVVSDAAVLGGIATGMLMIIRPEVTRKHPTRNAMRHLEELGSTQLGLVINGLDFRKATYFSTYDYYYSHYRYGYGDKYHAEDKAKEQGA